MKQISIAGKVLEVSESKFDLETSEYSLAKIKLLTKNKQEHQVILKGIWSDASKYLWKDAQVFLHHIKATIDENEVEKEDKEETEQNPFKVEDLENSLFSQVIPLDDDIEDFKENDSVEEIDNSQIESNLDDKSDPEKTILTLDNHGYLVLEPEILVNPTKIRSAQGCIRKYYINKRQGVINLNYKMLLGTAVNNAFDLLITDKQISKQEVLEQVLKKMLIDFASLDNSDLPTPDRIKTDIENHLKGLMVWRTHDKFSNSIEKTTEPTFISYKYGLSGRLDLLVDPGKEAVTYELKTGKPPYSTPWESDQWQVACYQLLLESAYGCTNPDSYLIYSKARAKDLLKSCSLNYLIRRKVISIRNQIVAIDLAFIKGIKKNIPEVESGNCEKCFMKNSCFNICKTLKERECQFCGVKDICPDIYELPTEEELKNYRKLFYLVELERYENRKMFSRIFEQSEVIEKEGKLIKNLTYVNVEKNILTLESNKAIESEIRSGDLILLYSEKITNGEIYKANVKHIDRFQISLALKKELKLGNLIGKNWQIYKDTMETSNDVMNSAILNILSPEKTKLRKLLSGEIKPIFSEYEEIYEKNDLNEKQKYSINKALSAENYFLIQGPPGTGKTHTLANLVIELVKRGDKVLLSGFTHRSIDNVLIKLIENDFHDFLRIGSHEIVDKEVQPYLIQNRFSKYNIDDVLEVKDKINNYPVIACSSISALKSGLVSKINFDIAVIDEAGQLTEPAAIAIVLQSKKFVLVGDHKQLPPVVQNDKAKKLGFSRSLFEKLININKENQSDMLSTLEEQYRMNENIMQFSNQNFYENFLKANKHIAKQTLQFPREIKNSNLINILEPKKPMIFVDSAGINLGKSNQKEARKILEIVKEFIKFGISNDSIGVITPFRAQVAEIKRSFLSTKNQYIENVAVDTVDRFQGSDRDIIIFSSVLASVEDLSDFFNDFRRINVTLTRAKKKFILVGSKDTLQKSNIFSKIIQICH